MTEPSTERGEHWSEAKPPPADELLDWFAAGVTPLTDVDDCGTRRCRMDVDGRQTSGFWARRMAVETAVHRYDAQLAAGDPQPVERMLAADGVDEYLDVLPFWPGYANVRGNGAFSLHRHRR